MTNQITTSKEFQERVFEKIREQIGTLLTEQELKSIVEKSMERAFFEPRIIKKDYGRTEEYEPILVEMVRELLKNEVREEVRTWLKNNSDSIGDILNRVISKGMIKMITSYFDDICRSHTQCMAQNIKMDINNL